MGADDTDSFEDIAFEVEFMSCVTDKADNLKVTESDSHFSEFTGVHPSKINEGKLCFLDLIIHKEREAVMKQLCKKNSPYAYLDFYIKNKNGDYVHVYCIAQSIKGTTLCRLALADVSQNARKTEALKQKNENIKHLVEMVEGGVCVFKVNRDMLFNVSYMNSACCRLFGIAPGAYVDNVYKLEELIYKDDKSEVYQAIGKALATKKPIDLEVRVITHRNSYTWCKLNSAIQRIDDDGLPVFHAVFTDISRIKTAEQKADTQRDILVGIFKNLPGPQFYTDLETPLKPEIVSRDFMKLIGYSRTEFFETLGGDLRKLIVPGDSLRAENEIKTRAAHDGTLEVEYTVITKTGERVKVADKRRIVNGENGERSTLGILTRI
ncbi:MAG: PAS domain-containing protein [Eubacterium sp.]|nr:PAS domain-containing protein [Eubacterium sp.]